MPNKIRIEVAGEITLELLEAMQRLIPQLTSNNPPPLPQELEAMLASPCVRLYIARHVDFGDEIVGLATLILYRVPTGMRGYIEDVIVDEKARRGGIGRLLTLRMLEDARLAGAAQVGLTSNPARQAANRLYESLDFVLRQTNVYQYRFRRKDAR